MEYCTCDVHLQRTFAAYRGLVVSTVVSFETYQQYQTALKLCSFFVLFKIHLISNLRWIDFVGAHKGSKV
jgi:hypothetical protein